MKDANVVQRIPIYLLPDFPNVNMLYNHSTSVNPKKLALVKYY